MFDPEKRKALPNNNRPAAVMKKAIDNVTMSFGTGGKMEIGFGGGGGGGQDPFKGKSIGFDKPFPGGGGYGNDDPFKGNNIGNDKPFPGYGLGKNQQSNLYRKY